MARSGLAVVLAAFACAAPPPEGADELDLSHTQPGDPLPGLTAAQLAAFKAGKAQFANAEDASEGLGPVFNEASCVACHIGPASGGGNGRLETRFGRVDNGVFDPLASLGGSLLQDHAIAGFTAEAIPAQANVVARRRTTPLFGLGLVEAVPDDTFRDLAAIEKLVHPRTAGIVSQVTNLVTGAAAVGKLGWKGQNPTVFQFCADAYLNEMGITSPLFPNESCPQGDCSLLAGNPAPGLNDDGTDVRRFTDFITYLAPIAPAHAAPGGEGAFRAIGCADCHTPTLKAGRNAVKAISNAVFHPYSDFLLHDMGSLGDGITQGMATGRLMRTQPLWGLRFQQALLHDGRATNVTDAILAHDGQAAASREKFRAMPAEERAELLSFLSAL